MATKSTADRRGRSAKDTKSMGNEMAESLANFTLPDSLPCSEIDFPILIQKKMTANWDEVVEESEQTYREIKEYEDSKKEVIPKSPFLKTECEYMNNEIFTYLIPALEETLNKAKLWDALIRQACFFNGIDHISQVLWNNNPRYPERKVRNLYIFNMPWVKEWLKLHPRPYFPKSWLWPEDYAATLIQKTVRQYFVQREEEVQEMRDFWRKLEVEINVPEMHTNPFLAKKFASEPNFRKK